MLAGTHAPHTTVSSLILILLVDATTGASTPTRPLQIDEMQFFLFLLLF